MLPRNFRIPINLIAPYFVTDPVFTSPSDCTPASRTGHPTLHRGWAPAPLDAGARTTPSTARSACALDSLAAKEERVEQPVLPNSERLRSGQRGMTRALLFGVKAFYAKHNALDPLSPLGLHGLTYLQYSSLSTLAPYCLYRLYY